MNRRFGYVSLLTAVLCLLVASAAARFGVERLTGELAGVALQTLVVQLLFAAAVVLGTIGSYLAVSTFLLGRTEDKRRRHDLRNLLRFAFVVLGTVGILTALTQQYVGVLFSLGIVGFAVTFARQQPLLSLIGWVYIMLKRPYEVGDRVAIGGSKGDVVEVDLFVTTLWDINGELVSSNQPSGRVITLPDSVVLSSQVYNYSYREFPHVRNELYERILDRLNEHPDRVPFPVSRSR